MADPNSAPTPARSDQIKSDPTVVAADDNHLSNNIDMNQWLRLLVVVTTLLLLTTTVIVAVRLLSAIGHTLLLFSLGGLLAYALDPLVERLKGSGSAPSARTRAALALFGGIALLTVLGFWLLGSQLTRQISLIQREHKLYEYSLRPDATLGEQQSAAQTYEAQAHQKLHDIDVWLAERKVNVNLEDTLAHPPPKVKTYGQKIADTSLKVAGSVGHTLVEGVIVLLISLYFLIYATEMREKTNRALPARLRAYAEQWQDDVNRVMGGFVRGQLILALVMGAMGALICLLLGIKFWLLIGLFVVVASLIPIVGPYIGAIPAVISALLTPGGFLSPVVRVALLIVVFVIINEFGSKILYPKLVGAALGLHEVLVLFILLAGFEVGGLTGVLFAAPLTTLSVVTLAQLYRLWQGDPPAPFATKQGVGGTE